MITLCCPTRGRPASMRRLYESIVKTAYCANEIELIFYIDNDDEESLEEFNRLALIPTSNIGAVIDEPIILSETWNQCMQAGQGPIYMVCADDIVFESKDWDKYVIDKFDEYPDKIVLIYGMDGGKNERLATHPFIHKNWIDTVGYFTPPYFHFCMCDTWLFNIANKINRVEYIKEVVTAHWNCTNRTYTSGEPDKIWLEMQARGIAQSYRRVYHSKGEERLIDSQKLLKFIQDFGDKNAKGQTFNVI